MRNDRRKHIFLHPGTLPGTILTALCLAATPLLADTAENPPSKLVITPESVVLQGQGARQQLLVTAWRGDRPTDVTRTARLRSTTPSILSIDARGVVTPLADGSGVIQVSAHGLEASVKVEVISSQADLPVTLERDVMPVLTRKQCNSGACHGKARGQNGFMMSLLGFDPDLDFESLVQDSLGRRVFPAAPERSLLLQKPTATLPHGGGKRFEVGSFEYNLLRRWITQGFPRNTVSTPALEKVTAQPQERPLVFDEEQQLLVTAHYSDGTRRDVTHLATFMSSESAVVEVDHDGLLKSGPIPGESAIMARYSGEIAICHTVIPLPGKVPAEFYANLPRHNFIDDLVWKKLERLGITPSEPATDAKFLRRAYLDVIGRLPTPQESRTFLADSSADKRPRLVDQLLERPEYADYWSTKWSDLLLPNPYRVGIKGVFNLHGWLRDAFRRDLPYDEFVRAILTAQGSVFDQNAAVIYRDRREPEEIVTMVSQLFLGIRLGCAQCHHHPFERWDQTDFFGLASFFSRIGRKGSGLSPPISPHEEIIFVSPEGSVKHPRTGETLAPRPLFGSIPPIPVEKDPRAVLADWMAASDNVYFPRVQVNRVWKEIMGKGIVDPVDDLRMTNPPSNEELLDALASSFREQGFSTKGLIRTILNSYVYGLSSLPSERNAADIRNYSRRYRQQPTAEVLLDAISDITLAPAAFDATVPGTRAQQLWTRRIPSDFLMAFERPDPNQDPPCERMGEANLVQALHLMNSPGLHEKVTADGARADLLARSDRTPRQIAEELYLLTYCRFPAEDEIALCLQVFEDAGKEGTDAGVDAKTRIARATPEKRFEAQQEPALEPARADKAVNLSARREAAQDILWALLNTPEFIFKD